MTSTVPRLEERQLAETHRTNRGALIIFIALAMAIAALGGWLLRGRATDAESAMPANVEQLIDAYLAAWENLDADSMRAVTTLDFAINEYWYEAAADRTFMIEHIDDNIDGAVNTGLNPSRQWQAEQVGEPIIVGDGPWFVSIWENWALDNYRGDGMATYVIVADGGTLKIANHFWSGLKTRTQDLSS